MARREAPVNWLWDSLRLCAKQQKWWVRGKYPRSGDEDDFLSELVKEYESDDAVGDEKLAKLQSRSKLVETLHFFERLMSCFHYVAFI